MKISRVGWFRKSQSAQLFIMKVKSRSQRIQEEHELVLRIILVGSGSFFLLVIMTMAWYLPSNNASITQDSHWTTALVKRKMDVTKKKRPHRLAMVLPFVGQSPDNVPTYLNLFCRGARAAADVADFLLIHNGVLAGAERLSFCHSNVILIDLHSTEAIAERLLRVLNDKDEGTWEIQKERLLKILATYLNLYPYALVEYKPAFGTIFEDLLEDYSHWGYSDLDIVFGDLGRHIEESEWNDYDIVTYGFGDQQRLYMRGQFTMHKNTARIRDLWKGCDYLWNLDERFHEMIEKQGRFQLESAEGCYSAVILQNFDISVKFAVKAWTDVSRTDSVYSHGLYLFQNPNHPHKHILAKALPGETNDNRLLDLSRDWFYKDPIYNNRKQPLQRPSGAMEPLRLPGDYDNNEDKHCMYWIQEKYQKYLCLHEQVSDSENVFWVKGQLHKQAFLTTPLKSKVDTGPFFHFQEWKRRIRKNQIVIFDDTGATVAVFLESGGVVVDQGGGSKKRHASQPSPLGIPTSAWDVSVSDRNRSKERPSYLPKEVYCLSGNPDKFRSRMQCTLSLSWGDVELLSQAPEWKHFSTELDVTLVQTLRLYSPDKKRCQASLNTIAENLRRWKGQPSVVLVYASPAVENPSTLVSMALVELQIQTSLIGVLSPVMKDTKEDEPNFVVSQKTLQNMAMDVVPTRWYIIGLDDGDMILSHDAVHFARRKASIYQTLPGNIFIVPKFAFDTDGTWNISDLLNAIEMQTIKTSVEYGPCKEDETEDELSTSTTFLWSDQTKAMLFPDTGPRQPSALAKNLQEIEYKLTNRLRHEEEQDLFISAIYSPLLLVDNVIRNGRSEESLHANTLSRAVEEFGGGLCFNLLRLSQLILFGFQLNVLDGAFAASTRESRNGRLDDTNFSPDCGGCFFLEGAKHLRDQIFHDEVIRPIIARSMWERGLK